MADNDSMLPDGEEDFATLFEATQAPRKAGKAAPRRIAAGDQINCRVIAIGAASVFVAVGEKAEGSLDIAEFRDPATGELTVAVGDEIRATVVDDGSRSGSAVLTRILGRGGRAAAELVRACELGVPVEGMVSGEVKGGYEVHFGAVRAFCPGSQIDLRRGGDRAPASDYVGRRFAFRVERADEDGRSVVVSRRAILEEEQAEAARLTWERIRPGAVLSGTVRSVRDFGAFVDLGGVDGMVHVSELAHARVKHPSEVVEVGQRVEVQVLRVADAADKDGRRQVALSLKALAEDPWTTLESRFPAGSTAAGTVTRVEPYGAFVQLLPGLEGLVHISRLVLDRRLTHAKQAVTPGQQVEVTVLGIDREQRRVSLSMVEQDQQARVAEAAAERREHEQVLAAQRGSGSLGTFADLLAEARTRKNQ